MTDRSSFSSLKRAKQTFDSSHLPRRFEGVKGIAWYSTKSENLSDSQKVILKFRSEQNNNQAAITSFESDDSLSSQ